MNRFTAYIPAGLILGVCVFLAISIPHLGAQLVQPMRAAGADLPMLSIVVMGAVQNGVMSLIVLCYGVLSALSLFLFGRNESYINYQSLICSLFWIGIVFFLVVVMFAFYLPFIFMGFALN